MLNKNPIAKKNNFNKITKYGLYLLAFVVVIVLTFRFIIPFSLNIFWGRDVVLIDDSVMELPIINISETDNSFYDLMKLHEIVDLNKVPEGMNLDDDFLESDSWDNDQVEALLGENILALEYFSDAASKAHFQSTASADPTKFSPSAEVIPMAAWRQAAQLSCVKAIFLAKNNNLDEAVSELMKVMAVGDAIEKSQSFLITYMMGLSLKNYALDTIEKINENTDSKELLLRHEEDLLSYSLVDNKSPWIFEYLVYKQGILNIKEGGYDLTKDLVAHKGISPKTNYYFKPNLSIEEVFKRYLNIIDESKNPCDKETQDKGRKAFKAKPNLGWYFSENIVNKVLMANIETTKNLVFTKKCAVESKYIKLISELRQ